MTNSVPCPCCNMELYSTTQLNETHSTKSKGAELKQANNRIFMICPNCQNEIEFIGSGQLRLSPIQPCTKTQEKS